MEQHDGHTHLTTEEASGGSREGVVRWVLLGGLLLAIGLLSVTWIVPALMHDDVAAEGDVSGKIQAEEAQVDPSTDSIVDDRVDPAQTGSTTETGAIPTVENETDPAQ